MALNTYIILCQFKQGDLATIPGLGAGRTSGLGDAGFMSRDVPDDTDFGCRSSKRGSGSILERRARLLRRRRKHRHEPAAGHPRREPTQACGNPAPGARGVAGRRPGFRRPRRVACGHAARAAAPANRRLRRRRRARAAARAGRRARAGAGARAARVRRAGRGARVARGRGASRPVAVRRDRGRVRSHPHARRVGRADHDPRRLRRRRRHVDGDPRRRAAQARRRGRLVLAEPRRGRLRAVARDRRAPRGPRHAAADHGGLRDHRGRRGRGGGRRRDRRRRHRSPLAAGRRGAADAPIVHPAVCGYPCVDLCAAGVAYKLAAALLAAAGEDPPARTPISTSSRSRRSPTACRCAARTAGSCARACARSRRPSGPACARS